ncbi:MAG TPA: VIT1/CCC1 transporter family protein [Cyclobacteriaceae bacterium]|jgi:VIT1/CCC1 family predicted Fe2+/Mn2+ transporter
MERKHSEERLHKVKAGFGKFTNYLREFVYGGMDGSVTTFAVVAGAEGANLGSTVIIILGFANLLADGFAMSVGSYLSSKSDNENYERHKKTEYWEVENIPEAEREEIREIYRQKGFEGELLEDVVRVITADKDRWVNVMMKEELEMIPENKSPFAMGAATFISFVLVGLIPLMSYVADSFISLNNTFAISAILTTLAFVIIGMVKTKVTQTSIWKGVMETLILGCSAAVVSYLVGFLLESFVP